MVTHTRDLVKLYGMDGNITLEGLKQLATDMEAGFEAVGADMDVAVISSITEGERHSEIFAANDSCSFTLDANGQAFVMTEAGEVQDVDTEVITYSVRQPKRMAEAVLREMKILEKWVEDQSNRKIVKIPT